MTQWCPSLSHGVMALLSSLGMGLDPPLLPSGGLGDLHHLHHLHLQIWRPPPPPDLDLASGLVDPMSSLMGPPSSNKSRAGVGEAATLLLIRHWGGWFC